MQSRIPLRFLFFGSASQVVAPLPKGWAAYNNTAYRVDFGEGVMRGPDMIVRFSVASAPDRKLFDSLFVLQAERDRIDEKYVWVDRTDAGARDFNTKTISARTNELGFFVGNSAWWVPLIALAGTARARARIVRFQRGLDLVFGLLFIGFGTYVVLRLASGRP